MANVKTPTPVVNNKQKVSKFKQQNLPAWQPIFHGRTAFPIFLIIGVIFIPTGVVLLIISNEVKEFTYDYTHCWSRDSPTMMCVDIVEQENLTGTVCHCSIVVSLEEFHKPVYIYYGLNNFYQNHRRYVRSRDDNQLHGSVTSPKDLRSECDPFGTVIINETEVYGYAPCGAIANSLFNDTIKITYNDAFPVPLLHTGIAWTSDKESKFNNPSTWESFTQPQNWPRPVWELDPEVADNNGYSNEDLIVWMRTAALPNFRKLYRRVDHSEKIFANGLPAGDYTIDIVYNYPVSSFGGSKLIYISTTSLLGGKNPFLGIAYIVVGCIHYLVGFLFLIHMCWKQKYSRTESETETGGVKVVKFKSQPWLPD